jgi:hypothetical protein
MLGIRDMTCAAEAESTEISQDLDREKLRDDGSLLLSPAWAETVYD